jgi:hypothetical protein
MKPGDDMADFLKNGLKFSCTSCGHCCRHEPGYVFLSEADLKALADHMSIPVLDFMKQYCRTVDLGIVNRLSLNETVENDCVFWSGGCTVYEHRPLQCRTYPFWPAILGSQADWDRESLECPGMNQGEIHSARSIKAFLRQRTREILISPKR